MILKPELIALIQRGIKTQTRRPVSDNPNSPWWAEHCRLQPGRAYIVQPGRGQPAALHITVSDVRKECLGDISPEDTLREGFKTRDEFLNHWKQLHGSPDLDRMVWVISFKPGDTIERPRLPTARPGTPAGDYTDIRITPRLSLVAAHPRARELTDREAKENLIETIKDLRLQMPDASPFRRNLGMLLAELEYQPPH